MKQLIIEQFKCFQGIEIPINNLTVFAGGNGNGKSTAIQALLYLRRTIEHCGEWRDKRYYFKQVNGLNVPLNGVYCLSLGDSSFVLNKNYNGNNLSIGLSELIKVIYDVNNREPQLWLTPTQVETYSEENDGIFKQEFYYLNAERLGPRVNQELRFFDYPNTGWQGETTAQVIDLDSGYYKIDNNRRFSGINSNFIKDQINHWLDYIIEGVNITVKSNPATLSAQILISNEYTTNDPTLSTNLGFGISYLLPILATGLIAEPGSYFIVENPEAHLHPSAQSKVGKFLAMVANAGVNVIVETHSDHLINGIQIAVAEKAIENTKVIINFFSKEKNVEKSVQPQLESIEMSEKAEIKKWPQGFFDQAQIDYTHLLKIRNNV